MNWYRLLHDHFIQPDDQTIQHCFSQSNPNPRDQRSHNNIDSELDENSDSEAKPVVNGKHIEPTNKQQIRILTLNVWGLPVVPHCYDRCQYFCTLLQNYDIICLQECLHLHEVNLIIEHAQSVGLIHCIQFIQGIGYPVYNSVVASGLVILSRYNVVYTHYNRYTVNGHVEKLQHSDYYLAKGVAHCRVKLHNNNYADVYTTHTHANYSGVVYDVNEQYNSDEYEQQVAEIEQYNQYTDNTSGIQYPFDDIYLAHRVAQLYQMATYINNTRCDKYNTNNIVLVAADLNCVPNDISLQLLLRMTGLYDAMCNSLEHTYGCIHNTFSPLFVSTVPDTATKLHKVHSNDTVSSDKKVGHDGSVCDTPTRIDYILYSKSNSIQFTDSSVLRAHTYIDQVQQNVSISDHHGVQATFEYIDTTNNDTNIIQQRTNNHLPTIEHILQCCILILWYGYIDATNRRDQHWNNVFRLFTVLVLLFVIQYTPLLQISIIFTVHTISFPIQHHTVFDMLYTYSTIIIECSKLVAMFCAVVQLYLCQYSVREEQQALRQTMQEINIYYQNLVIK